MASNAGNIVAGVALLAVLGVAGTQANAAASDGHSADSGHKGGAVATLENLIGSIRHLGSSGPVSGAAEAAVTWAEGKQGLPYQWGGTGPGAFDCSGLVMQAYAAAGVSIPRTSQAQWAWGVSSGKQVPMSGLKPGDLVFYAGADGTPTSPGHVVMYAGGGRIVEAYAPGTPIHVVALGSMPGEQAAVGAIRPTAGG
jgi:cell wall-associated NlpC family hydrolase